MELTPEPLSRPELDAKLQALETRMDAKIERMEFTVNALSLTVNEFMRESRETSRSLRWWIAGMMATVILSIPATYAVNWSIVQSVTAVYESGRSAAPRP
jgi:hypothetical protein